MENKEILSNLLKKKYTKKVYIDIFNILSAEKYSTNSNGIFFNLKEIPDEKINKCIDYINILSYNVEDHMKNLSLREELEKQYKNSIHNQPIKVVQKQQVKKKIINKEEFKEIISPFGKRNYKSKVFKRLDNIMLGKKKEDKHQKSYKKPTPKEKIKEDESDNESIENEDLFGDEEEDFSPVIKEVMDESELDYESE